MSRSDGVRGWEGSKLTSAICVGGRLRGGERLLRHGGRRRTGCRKSGLAVQS